jgi:hypothetical protein
MTTETKQNSSKAAEQSLREAGAAYERREDRHGYTRSGWWLDEVYLGKSIREALAAIQGGG